MAQLVKNPPAMQETRFNPWVGKIPWRRAWQPTPVLFPWIEEPDRLQSMTLQRIGQNWATQHSTASRKGAVRFTDTASDDPCQRYFGHCSPKWLWLVLVDSCLHFILKMPLPMPLTLPTLNMEGAGIIAFKVIWNHKGKVSFLEFDIYQSDVNIYKGPHFLLIISIPQATAFSCFFLYILHISK